ncbi:MAG: SRPBCC domain-containing protein, partial [Flavobacteriaceae bacterium]|nr:SRPBCC domain-containing protein [Flavobacteriaceae bacterium]
MKHTDPPIIAEQILNAPIGRVWKAITQVDQMHQWFFDNIPSFKAEVGFETQFNVKSET